MPLTEKERANQLALRFSELEEINMNLRYYYKMIERTEKEIAQLRLKLPPLEAKRDKCNACIKALQSKVPPDDLLF